ncbi:Vta1 like-domain-containing protein [Podospora appendiculata]|uniref:Vta1 like-domain-containing protein n=1 Tax=Podospora appendiculata TaxID=314037 RepID=A0AAE1CH74_9PEZI|nr:Vta1 like-domain-containing protein [Podospora appendiculata]
MADNIPPSLRQADITIWKCATKAAQLQTIKPIIAYWCEYWVVNQILAKQLHTTGEDVLLYTTSLMDKLEQTKAEYPNEAAILDDAAGQAYVEQFAQETLDRAERVVKANRVSQQTATTFDAAATLFHLVNIWGPPDQETQQKIKYAKWNAARIAKAIKEGKDPNESNPKQEDIQQPTLDPEDPDVQRLTSPSSHLAPRPARVEEVPDVDLPSDAAGVSLPHSPASVVPSAVSDGELHLPGVPTTLGEPAAQPGYFDSEPSPVSPAAQDPDGYQAAPVLPPPPAGWSQPQPSPGIPPPPAAWSQDPRIPPPTTPGWRSASDYSQAPTAPPTFATAPPSTAAVASPPVNPPTDAYYMNMRPTAHTANPAVPQMTAAQNYASASVDEAAMVGAQKHAKWAISALNFEDVPTAVRELRKALEMLGAS